MSPDQDPHADVVARLWAFGQQPVDPSLQSEHLTAMASVRSGGSVFRTSLAGRLKVAAGVFAGFLIGATGLTTAGALGPLQPIAADVVESVAPVDVPKGKADEAKAAAKAAKAAREGGEKGGSSRLADGSIGTQRMWAGCYGTGGSLDAGPFAGNRGQYLKQERAAGRLAEAKGTDCGKPVGGDDDEAEGTTDDLEATEAPEVEDERSDDEGKAKGKESAPGQNGEKGKSDDAGKPEDPGSQADDAGKPETVPAPSLPEQADPDATDKAPEHAPGAPAQPDAKPEDV